MTSTHSPTDPDSTDAPQFTLAEAGSGRPVLILHGGGGPATVASIAQHLGAQQRTLTPTHPGWNGTPRPDWLTGIDDLALLYLNFLEDQNLRGVVVIGSSIGGWIAAEMAVRDAGTRLSGLILVNAVGIEVEHQPIRDVFSLDARGLADSSFHDPERFFLDPASLPPEQQMARQANRATLRLVAGDMYDPKLRRRLGRIRVPTLVLWGESDQIVTPAYGAAYAAAVPKARFELVEQAGHLPQIEQPAATFALIDRFLGQLAPYSAPNSGA